MIVLMHLWLDNIRLLHFWNGLHLTWAFGVPFSVFYNIVSVCAERNDQNQ